MAYLIGICGHAGTGKDTLAVMLQAESRAGPGKGALIRSFADPIRGVAASLGLRIYSREHKEQVQKLRFEHFEDTFADILIDCMGDLTGQDSLCELFCRTASVLRDRGYLVDQTLTISPRRFAQLLGTEGGRTVRKGFWIDILRAHVAHYPDEQVFIVPDVRFPNEASAMDRLIGLHRAGTAPVEEHESESYTKDLVLGADFNVANHGSLQNLEHTAAALWADICKIQ